MRPLSCVSTHFLIIKSDRLQRIVHSVLSSRLILNLRSASQNREDGPMTTIAFAHDSGCEIASQESDDSAIFEFWEPGV